MEEGRPSSAPHSFRYPAKWFRRGTPHPSAKSFPNSGRTNARQHFTSDFGQSDASRNHFGLVQAREPQKSVNAAMRDGAGTAFLAGLLLVGVLEAGDSDVNNVKIGVKFAVGLVILVLVMANARKPSIPRGLYVGLLVLGLLNVALAVFWSPTHA